MYEAIIADFGFARRGDELARDELAQLMAGGGYRLKDLPDAHGSTIAVVGAAGRLGDDLGLVGDADYVYAASEAAGVVRAAGIDVTLQVTDLDKEGVYARQLTHEGVPVAVHAHGDNRDLITEHVPKMRRSAVLPTTQVEPRDGLVNVGGFTDGDRAAFLAHACGARRLTFPGWTFDDPTVSPMKRRKLRWAERLLLWLERFRDDHFAILDGRREEIDLSAFPSPWSQGEEER